MPKYGMVIDLDRCQGCRACMEACKIENNTVEHAFWMYTFRFEQGTFPDTKTSFMPRPCQHCENAPCAKVCPVGARYKREDGLVLTDSERCIGCRYCELACPYAVNYFNWKEPADVLYYDWADSAEQGLTGGAVPGWLNPELSQPQGEEQRYTAGGSSRRGVMTKCTFCVQRVDKGLQPACVTSCPLNVLTFGDMSDPESEISKTLRGRSNDRWVLLDEAGTEPKVHYVGGSPPASDTREIEPVQGSV